MVFVFFCISIYDAAAMMVRIQTEESDTKLFLNCNASLQSHLCNVFFDFGIYCLQLFSSLHHHCLDSFNGLEYCCCCCSCCFPDCPTVEPFLPVSCSLLMMDMTISTPTSIARWGRSGCLGMWWWTPVTILATTKEWEQVEKNNIPWMTRWYIQQYTASCICWKDMNPTMLSRARSCDNIALGATNHCFKCISWHQSTTHSIKIVWGCLLDTLSCMESMPMLVPNNAAVEPTTK